MNCFSQSCLFNVPHNSSRYNDENVQEIEIRASKALNNIHSLYKEIMSPRDITYENNEVINIDSKHQELDNQHNHYLKTCCSTLKELCINCDKFVTKCSSCNKCSCSISRSRNEICDDIPLYGTDNQHFIYSYNSKVNVTVPKPFSFISKISERQKAKECKISKIKAELNNKVEEELKVRVHTKPVPRTTHLPIYKQMVQEKEKQKLERKERCSELLNSSKPFNLHTSKLSVKSKSSSDLTTEKNFKAKPAPKHILDEKVSKKIREREKIRKMLITERAKYLLEQSSLPFSKRSMPASRSLINLSDFTYHNKSTTKSKNISEITNRLYAKKCNETIECWNKKVQQVNTCKKMDLEKHNLLQDDFLLKHLEYKTEEMPFFFFPIRMSNAAVLREKQIRAEILARKVKEDKQKINETAKKRINTDILVKLKTLTFIPENEKEIEEKVKSFRESQVKRQEEYEEELQEILKRVSERHLLIERQSKVGKNSSNKSNISDRENTVNDESEESASNSNHDDTEKDSDSDSHTNVSSF